ncbi:hypothetical protein ACJMK2_040768 [Sinanodonta woodiana]|uniref:CABIT domain-containing protein n=1 Tax=Sinanodonta woodiana TaxID=1069815 RepID=A0ABD3W3D5_SINWO
MDILKDFEHYQSSSTTAKKCVESLGFPCILTVKRDIFNSDPYDLENESLELCPGTVIKLFAELSLPSVRLKIEKLHNPKNVSKERGKDFVSDRSPFEGSEINIPLNFKGNVKRLRNTGMGRKYESVSKLMEDLPSCVQALDKFSCVSHGTKAPVTIGKGTKLVPARNLQKNPTDTASIDQLICILENGNEIAIPENCKVRFVVVEDDKTFTVRDIVEKLTLPQAVQFETVFPENVVSRDDEEACNLMYMLDGPVSVISVERTDVYVGCLSRMSGKYIPFILPVLHEVEVYTSDKTAQRYLGNLYAPHLPSSLPLSLVEDKLYIIDTEGLHVHYLKDIDLNEAPMIPPPRPRKSNDITASALASNAPPVHRRPQPYEARKFPIDAGSASNDIPKVPPKAFKNYPEASTQKFKAIKPLPPEPIPSTPVLDHHDSSEECTDSCYEDVSLVKAETKNPPVPPRLAMKPDKMEANSTQQKKQEKERTTSSSEKPPKVPIPPTLKVESFSDSRVQPLKRSPSTKNRLSSSDYLGKGKTVQGIDDEVMDELRLPSLVPKKSTIEKFKNLKSEMFRFVHGELRKKFKTKKPLGSVEISTDVTNDIKSKSFNLDISSDKRVIQTDLDLELEEDDNYDTIEDDCVFENSNLTMVEKDTRHANKSIQRVQSQKECGSDEDDEYIQIQDNTMPSNLTKRPGYIDQQMGINTPKGMRYVPFPESKRTSKPDKNKDFFSMSVEEVVYLFEECKLPALAEVCKKELLDGAFFKEFKEENWMEEPFCLKRFHVVKVQKILSGWRPDLDRPE